MDESLAYIRRFYGVPAHRRQRVQCPSGQQGTITSGYHASIRVRVDGVRGGRRAILHPTWKVVYCYPPAALDRARVRLTENLMLTIETLRATAIDIAAGAILSLDTPIPLEMGGRASSLLPVVWVATDRPDVRDIMRVHQLDGAGEVVTTSYALPDGRVLLHIAISAPATCTIVLIFSRDYHAWLEVVAATGVFVLSCDPVPTPITPAAIMTAQAISIGGMDHLRHVLATLPTRRPR